MSFLDENDYENCAPIAKVPGALLGEITLTAEQATELADLLMVPPRRITNRYEILLAARRLQLQNASTFVEAIEAAIKERETRRRNKSAQQRRGRRTTGDDPTFSHPLFIRDPEEAAVMWYLYGTPAEPLDYASAAAQVRDGQILAPHFYSLQLRDGQLAFFVPDRGGEHTCDTVEEATRTLRRVVE